MPRICTGIPSTITLVPVPAMSATVSVMPNSTAAAAQTGVSSTTVPSTIITFTRTLTMGTVTTQAVTVPQVTFNTITQPIWGSDRSGSAPTTTLGVGLVPASSSIAREPSSTPSIAMASASVTTQVATSKSTLSSVDSSKTVAGETASLQPFTGGGSRMSYSMISGIAVVVATSIMWSLLFL